MKNLETTTPNSWLENWHNYLNDVLGVLTFTAGLTALQFGVYASEIATLSLAFIMVLAYSIGHRQGINKLQRDFEQQHGLIKALSSYFKSPVFLAGIMFLFAVAAGMDASILEGYSLKYLFDV